MLPITLWSLKTKIVKQLENGEQDVKYVWLHNHIEDGHNGTDIPLIKFATQNGWKSGTWQKKFAHLDKNYTVIYNYNF